MSESALTHKTPPGTYRCSWNLSKPADDATWQSEGEITLQGGRRPFGGVYGRAPIHFNRDAAGRITGYGAPQNFIYPTVSGTLANGSDVVLVDARLRVWSPDRNTGFSMTGPNARISAWAALTGRGTPTTPDVLVDSGVIQLRHLDAFVARPPIEETSYPAGLYEDDDPSFQMKFRKDSCQTWSDDHAEVEVEYRISAGVNGGYHFHVTFSPTVRVTLKAPVPIKDFFTSWVLPLQSRTSTSQPSGLERVSRFCSCCVVGSPCNTNRTQFSIHTTSSHLVRNKRQEHGFCYSFRHSKDCAVTRKD